MAAVADNIGWILFYFGTLIPACWVIPSVLRNLIISHRLDSNSFALSSYFRFNDAHWYYLLSGRDKKIPELIFVSTIVQIETKAWIYEGILSDYRLRNDAILDYICLRGVERRTIEEYDNLFQELQYKAMFLSSAIAKSLLYRLPAQRSAVRTCPKRFSPLSHICVA